MKKSRAKLLNNEEGSLAYQWCYYGRSNHALEAQQCFAMFSVPLSSWTSGVKRRHTWPCVWSTCIILLLRSMRHLRWWPAAIVAINAIREHFHRCLLKKTFPSSFRFYEIAHPCLEKRRYRSWKLLKYWLCSEESDPLSAVNPTWRRGRDYGSWLSHKAYAPQSMKNSQHSVLAI